MGTLTSVTWFDLKAHISLSSNQLLFQSSEILMITLT